MVDIQTISVVIGAASVVVAMVTFIMNSRKEAKLREDQLIIQRFQGYGLELARSHMTIRRADWDSFEDFIKKYGYTVNPEFMARYNYVFESYNLAGVSLKRGADPDLIFQLYRTGSIIQLWEMYEPMTKWWRERTNDPSFREPFEYLYNEAKKRRPEIRQYVRQ
jgi:hypothetical protein